MKSIKNNKIIRNLFQKLYYQLCQRHFYALTGPIRSLPDFIIIGTARSGTTSLFYNICEHPSVIPAAYDEVGFFDSNYHLGINWYRSMFPTKKHMEKVKKKYQICYDWRRYPFLHMESHSGKTYFKNYPKRKIDSSF